MFGCGKGNLGAKLESCFYDAHVVGGDDDLIENFGLEATRPDMLDERFAGNAV